MGDDRCPFVDRRRRDRYCVYGFETDLGLLGRLRAYGGPHSRLQQSSPLHASRASLTTNQTIPSEVTASIHQTASSRFARRPTTTTRESQPHVMLSMASARIARLPSWRATVTFRRASMYMIGMATAATMRPVTENSPPC